MSGWIDTPHRCRLPRQQEVIVAKVNNGATWQCPDCSVVWTLEIAGASQVAHFVNGTTGLRRLVGFLP